MIGRSVIGALIAVIAFTPVVVGARRLTRRALPDLTGPVAALASVVFGVAIVVGVSELLGSVGGFRLVPLAIGLAVVGAVAARVRPRHAGSDDLPAHNPVPIAPIPIAPALTRSERVTRAWTRTAVVVVAVVGAEWTYRVVDAGRRGITTSDSLWYHLPIAARFVQDGWTSRLHFVDQSSLIVFYPATAELLHAIGMVFLGNDVVSLVLNVGWLAVALLAAWCIGSRFGVAPVTLVGAAILLATPELVLDDAGTGLNDIAGLALFLGAVALITNATRPGIGRRAQRAEMLCGALAAGLAAGTKYTMIGPVVALAVAVIVIAPRGGRLTLATRWTAVALLAGGYWYLRNLLNTGNPIPSMRFGVGTVHLPVVPYPGSTSVAHFLGRASVWRSYFVPGLREAFGPLWWGFAVIVGAAIICGLVRSGRPNRLLAYLTFAALAAFVFTPQVLGSPNPIFFAVNARYAAPGLLLAVVLLPLALRTASDVIVSAVLAAYVVVLAATQFAPSLWRNRTNLAAPPIVGSTPRLAGVGVGVVILLVGLIWSRRPTGRVPIASRRRTVAACATLALAVTASSVGVEHYYLHHRYRDVAPLVAVNRWARGVHHARIAIVDVVLQYPFYGTDLSNHVQYLAIRHRNGESETIQTCRAWRQAVNAGRFAYVIAASPGFPFAPTRAATEAEWTRSDPGAHLVAEDSVGNAHAWVFAVRGVMHPDACAT